MSANCKGILLDLGRKEQEQNCNNNDGDYKERWWWWWWWWWSEGGSSASSPHFKLSLYIGNMPSQKGCFGLPLFHIPIFQRLETVTDIFITSWWLFTNPFEKSWQKQCQMGIHHLSGVYIFKKHLKPIPGDDSFRRDPEILKNQQILVESYRSSQPKNPSKRVTISGGKLRDSQFPPYFEILLLWVSSSWDD